MALERFEKMFNEGFEFKTEGEIENFELHYPDVLKTDSEASRAAIKFFEVALGDEKRKLAAVKQLATEASISENTNEIKARIALINFWFTRHPEIRGLMTPKNTYEFYSLKEVEIFELNNPGVFSVDPVANKAARKCVDFELAHAKRMLSWVTKEQQRPNFQKRAEKLQKEVARLELWLEKHPAIDNL